MRELTRETVGTLDGLGGKGGRAIQGHQALIPEDPKTVEQMVRCKAPKDLNKDRITMARDDRIEEGTEVMVTGNLRDAKQGVGVLAALVGLELTLILQKRGRLGQEDAKGTSGSVLYRVTGIGAGFARVREGNEALGQDRLEIIKAEGMRHRCLLGAREISTLAKSVSIDNHEPLAKSKLELLLAWGKTLTPNPRLDSVHP